jgi:hypothetical protein
MIMIRLYVFIILIEQNTVILDMIHCLWQIQLIHIQEHYELIA